MGNTILPAVQAKKTWNHSREYFFSFFFLIPHFQLTDKSLCLYLQNILRIWYFPLTSCYILAQAFTCHLNYCRSPYYSPYFHSCSFIICSQHSSQSVLKSKLHHVSLLQALQRLPVSPRVTAKKLRLTYKVWDLFDLFWNPYPSCSLSSRLSVLHTISRSHRAFVLAVSSLF